MQGAVKGRSANTMPAKLLFTVPTDDENRDENRGSAGEFYKTGPRCQHLPCSYSLLLRCFVRNIARSKHPRKDNNELRTQRRMMNLCRLFYKRLVFPAVHDMKSTGERKSPQGLSPSGGWGQTGAHSPENCRSGSRTGQRTQGPGPQWRRD